MYGKLRSLSVFVLILFALMISSSARAGILYVNETSNTIEIAVVTTFGSHIYQDAWHSLNSGQSIRIGAGTFNKADTYWVVITEEKNGWNARKWRNYGGGRNANYEAKTAYVYPSGHKGQLGTNKHVAEQMRDGNWDPYLNNWPNASAYDALRINPQVTAQTAVLTIMKNGGYRLSIGRIIDEFPGVSDSGTGGGSTNPSPVMTGEVRLNNNYSAQVTIHLYHPSEPTKVFAKFVLAPSKPTILLYPVKPIVIGGDWQIDILFGNGVRSAKHSVEKVGSYVGNSWNIDATRIHQGP